MSSVMLPFPIFQWRRRYKSHFLSIYITMPSVESAISQILARNVHYWGKDLVVIECLRFQQTLTEGLYDWTQFPIINYCAQALSASTPSATLVCHCRRCHYHHLVFYSHTTVTSFAKKVFSFIFEWHNTLMLDSSILKRHDFYT